MTTPHPASLEAARLCALEVGRDWLPLAETGRFLADPVLCLAEEGGWAAACAGGFFITGWG
jgi:hypothetical protein